MQNPSGKDAPNWRGGISSGRDIAKRLYPLEGVICEWCGQKPATDRHHVDENTRNNKRSNIKFLCQSCHLGHHRRKEDRTAAIEKMRQTVRSPKERKRRSEVAKAQWARRRAGDRKAIGR